MMLKMRTHKLRFAVIATLLMAIILSAMCISNAEVSDDVSSSQELADAITNASDGEVIIVTLASDFDFEEEPIQITGGKTVNIRGGKRISGINDVNRSSRCLFEVDNGSVLNLEDATFDNVWIKTSGTFNMSGGELCNVKEYDYRNYTDVIHAVLVTGDGAEFNMTGGSIHDNEVGYGTVYVTDKARMNMSGGDISSNLTYGNGGGVYVYGDDGDTKVEFILSGGSITNNTANTGNGGGVCLNSEEEEGAEPHVRFEMTGGTVSGNAAVNDDFINSSGNKVTRGGYGGGIYCDTSGATINGGQIMNNDAYVYGGGIYLGIGSTLNISNAIITQNSAFTHVSELDVIYWSGVYSLHCAHPAGGGFWACPTGDEDFNVNDTLAIFDNECDNTKHRGDLPSAVISRTTKGIGDDFVAMPAFVGFNMTIADRTFDGYPVNWFHDGGNLEAVESLKGLRYDFAEDYNKMYNGSPNHWAFSRESSASERYAEKDDPEPVSKLKDINEAIALKSQISEEAKAVILARKDSGVYIAGNSAGAGGGIGSNGKVIAGNKNKKEQNISVKKSWHINVKDDEKSEVTIELCKDGKLIDSLILSEENNWEGVFEGLPEDEYEVVEILPDGMKNKKKIKLDETRDTIETEVFFENRNKIDKPKIEKTLEGVKEVKVTNKDDVYTYRIITTVPDDKESFVIIDELPEILKFTSLDDVKVYVEDEEAECAPVISGKVLRLELRGTELKEYEGSDIVIEFKAAIDKDVSLDAYKEGAAYKVRNVASYIIDNSYKEESSAAVMELFEVPEEEGREEAAEEKKEEKKEAEKEEPAEATTKGVKTGDKGHGAYLLLIIGSATALAVIGNNRILKRHRK